LEGFFVVPECCVTVKGASRHKQLSSRADAQAPAIYFVCSLDHNATFLKSVSVSFSRRKLVSFLWLMRLAIGTANKLVLTPREIDSRGSNAAVLSYKNVSM
jgi:hypothetical protein